MPRMDVATLLALAQSAVDCGNVPAACEFYEVALVTSPNNVEVLEAYAEIMIHHAQDTERGMQMLRHAINVNPDEGHIKYLNLAQLLHGREALECYRKAYEILIRDLGRARKKKDQKNIRRTISSVRCAAAELFLTDLCDDDDAEEQCETNVNDANFYCDDSVEVHQVRGSLRLSQRRNDEALEALRRAVELTHSLGEEYQPTYESKIELGRLLMQVCPVEAFRFLLEVLQMNDANPYVWFLLGESARMRKRYPDAARLLKRARQMVVATAETANPQALVDIDAAILVLVNDVGGNEAVCAIPNMDHPDPISLLEPEEDDEEGDDADKEPEWENANSDDEEQ